MSVPLVVIGLPVTEMPVPAVAATEVTDPPPVPAPIAVRNVAASSADTVLSALNLGNVTALGLVSVNMLPPTVVAPNDVRPVAGTKLVELPSQCKVLVYAVSHWLCLVVVGIE